MKAFKATLLALLSLLLLYQTGQSQVIFEGKVTDPSGNGIPGASVWTAKSDMLFSFDASTDQQGAFKLALPKRIKPPVYVRFTCTGYQSQTFRFEVLPAKDTVIWVKLNVLAISLDGVNIKSRGKKIDTTSFAADSLKRLYHHNIEQLLQQIPGLTVVKDGLMYKGRIISKVLFEGDNLSGSDYQHLLKSLSPHSLDSIQIIENYVDKTELGNTYKKYGDEIVLNFKFKGKKKVRNYGRVGTGIGLPGPVYEAALDNLALIKSLKMVNIANYNTKGTLTSYLFEKSNQYINSNGLSNTLAPPSILDRPPVSLLEPAPISPEQIGVERLYANKSAFFTTDFFDRINRRIFVKGNFKGLYDRIPEYASITEIFSDKSYVDTYRSSTILRRKLSGSMDANLNWLMNEHLQYTAGLKLSHAPTKSDANTFLNGISDAELYKGKNQGKSFVNQVTWLMPHKRNLKAEAYLGEEDIDETANRKSTLYSSLFNNSAVLFANQQFMRSAKYAGISARLESPLGKFTNLVFNNGLSVKKSDLNSNLDALDTLSRPVPTGMLFSNSIREEKQILYSQLELSREGRLWGHSFSTQLSGLFRYAGLKVSDLLANSQRRLSQQLLFDPRISFEYSLPNRLVFSADLFRTNRLPDPAVLYNGLVLYGQNQLRSGFDTLRVLANNGVSLQVRKTAEKGFFSIRYTYSNSDVTEGYAFASQGIFNFIKGVYLANQSRSSALHSSFFLNLSKTSISLDSYLNLSRNAYVLNGRKLNARQTFGSYRLTVRHNFSGNITNELVADFNSFSNKQTDETGDQQSNRVYNELLTDEFNIAFLKAWTATINHKFITMGGNGLNRERYYFLDLKVTRTSTSNRFTSYIEVRNMLNKKEYSVTSQNLFIQRQNYAAILPRMIIIGMEIKL